MNFVSLTIFFAGLLVFSNAYADSLDNSDFEKIVEEKICKDGFEKVIKKTNQKPACVKDSSVEKLIQRGWAQNTNLEKTAIISNDKSQTNPTLIAGDINSECSINIKCVISKLRDLGEHEDPQIFEETVSEILGIYDKKDRTCHTQGHHVGMFLYTYYGDVNKAVSMAGLECGGAVYHGILQNYFRVEKTSENFFDEFQANKICTEEFVDSKIKKYECLHGLGHGLAITFDYEIYEPLKFCEAFEGWEFHACSRGIFMENMIHVMETGEGTIDEQDIFYPCNAVDEKFAPDCYIFQTFYLAGLTKGSGSVVDTFSFCDMIEPKEFTKYCYVGLGGSIGNVSAKSVERAVDLCTKANIENQQYCFLGAVRLLADQKDIDTAFDFCKVSPQEHKDICYEFLGKFIDLATERQKEQDEHCSKAENSQYEEICKNASIDVGEFI